MVTESDALSYEAILDELVDKPAVWRLRRFKGDDDGALMMLEDMTSLQRYALRSQSLIVDSRSVDKCGDDGDPAGWRGFVLTTMCRSHSQSLKPMLLHISSRDGAAFCTCSRRRQQ